MTIESSVTDRVVERARLYTALGDPHRLAIVDQLAVSDRSPSELGRILNIGSNLLSHHLGVLEQLNLIERVASQGDQRRSYIRLVSSTLSDISLRETPRVERVVFICTENVARSQLASALWNQLGLSVTAKSGGTHPGSRVHPKAVRAARRRGLDLRGARPSPLPSVNEGDLVITVCDRAHEWLCARGEASHVHWSVLDPVVIDAPGVFDTTANDLADRIDKLVNDLCLA